MAVPIWKDKNVSLGSATSMYFRIKVGSDVIYQGKIVSSTGSSTALSVRINDICADWLAHARQSLSRTALANLTHPCTFAVEKSSNGSSWSTAESVQFWEDWSYDAKFLETSSGLAFPINGHIDKRQPIIWCSDTESGLIPASIRFTGSASVASIYLSTETTGTAAITCPSTTNDTDYLRAIRYGGPYVTSFRLGDKYSTRTDYKSITIMPSSFAIVYTVVTDCAEYALYYKNMYGGWDTFLIEGESIKGDALTRWTTDVNYSNILTANRGTYNFVNEIDRTLILNSGPLDSDMVSRMPNLLTSPDVWLYDIGRNEFWPVVLTDDTHEYRTVKQNGQKFVEYAIGVKVAQHFERR